MKGLYRFLMLITLFISAGITSVYAQDDGKRRITGTVTDENGQPLPGAYVYIKGTEVGTTTNLDGMYVIDINQTDELTFSFISYLEQTIKPRSSSNTLNVSLKPDTNALEEAVAVAYGAQKRQAIVSSLSTITTDDLKVTSTNITSSIQGQLPGLIAVQRNAEPGRDDAEFWIRGVSSFKGGTSPLVLVDGVERSITDLDADEIESFSLLKDAAATAMYGAEGANGVILVTTKRGHIGKQQISLRVEQNLSVPYRIPDFVDSWDYMRLANEALVNDGMEPLYSGDVIDLHESGADPDLYPNAQWTDLIARTIHGQRYTLSFRGGTENAKYFVTGGYQQKDGVFKKNPESKYNSNFSYDRFNLRSNIDLKVSKTTQLSIDLAGQYTARRTANRSPDDVFVFMLHTPPHLFPMVYSDGTVSTYPGGETDGNNRNPYYMLYQQGYRREFQTNIQSRVNLRQDLHFITEGLSARGAVSFDLENTLSKLRNYGPSKYHATGRDPETGALIYNQIVAGSPDVKQVEITGNTYDRQIYVEAALEYNNTFAGKHAVGAMLLYNQKERQKNNEALVYRTQGLVGRITYGYDNRYFIEANFGYTGSETFAKKNRFGFFPAVGASYMISNESWYPEGLKRVLSSAKVRASFGRTGNDDTGTSRFLYRATFSESGHTFNQGISSGGATNGLGAGIYDLQFENLTLGWEIEDKTNVGLDLSFFNRAIQIQADYFYNIRSAILLQRNTIPQYAGFHQNPWQNYGRVRNQGLDASIDMMKSFGDWKVSARGTFTFARNKVLEIDELTPSEEYQRVTGTRINEQELYIAERLYTIDDFIVTKNDNGTDAYTLRPGLPQPALGGIIGPGDIKYVDMNHDGIIDTNDKVRGVGHPYQTPEINFGFGFNVEWKGIYASVFFSGVANTSILLASGNSTFWPFNWGVEKGNYRTAFLDRWTTENPSQDVVYPRLHVGYGNSINDEPSTWWLRDGSFLRLKNAEIGYVLPEKALRTLKISGLRIYLLGENLCVFDHIKFWDPEQGNRNKGVSYPMQHSFTLGVQLDF
ncbi:MAG: TonB-dependent receptor [Bacteroidetes bacterium]|uniref:TonB-dependent receptor n=1 Tax=Candidatus Cryptobacteroides intestinavium TaxID=2840766 RepID=A0A9D9ES48_9BACT|nr:TonB-dependent receptor [Candidatus Cryptobacteroides intestinavium]